MQDMVLQLCIMKKYHCNYDIYIIPGLVHISLGYTMTILQMAMTNVK